MTIRGIARHPVKVGLTKNFHRFYVTPELCEEVILGKDWRYQHRAHIFHPTVLLVDDVETPLGEATDESVAVLADELLEQRCQVEADWPLEEGR